MTPKELSALLARDASAVAMMLLPNGRRNGREWCVGSVAGEEGRSMAVCLDGPKAGVWSDFATGQGGDLIDLWQQVRGLSFVETLQQVQQYLGVGSMPAFKERRYKKPERPKGMTAPTDRLYHWWSECGISKQTVQNLRVGQVGDEMVFPFLSPAGELEMVKYRGIGKKSFRSSADSAPCLFGWHCVDGNVREIVICEGEKDCLTFWQQGIPALSVPRGAGGGEKQAWIEYEYDRLERFAEIIVCMDNDPAGQEAVLEIIRRLGQHRCRVMDLAPHKDANEVHMNGELLRYYVDAAKAIDPEELKRLAEFHDEIMRELDPNTKDTVGVRLPWSKSYDEVRLRPAEVTLWAGINSHGKSVLLSQVMLDAVTQGTKWCVASMEMPAAKLGAKLYRQAAGNARPTAAMASAIRNLIDHSVYVFTTYGTAKAERILEVFEYARRRYGVTHFVIDSLAKCGFAEDDMNAQKRFIDRLFEYALQSETHIHLVVHMRKGQSEEDVPNKFDIKGTGALSDMTSNAFIVWRNKRKERVVKFGPRDAKEAKQAESIADESDALLLCCKQRETGVEPTYRLWYHGPSCQFVERSGEPPKIYLP